MIKNYLIKSAEQKTFFFYFFKKTPFYKKF